MACDDSGIRRLILASGSPRRRQLLSLLGLPFVIRVSNVDETPLQGESPSELVLRVSQAKAFAVPDSQPDELVIAADTVVVLDGQILGKPADAEEAVQMLRRLRDRSHLVYTGLSVWYAPQRRMVCELSQSVVWMRAYTDSEIDDYVASGDPLDKAGAYAIQHPGFDPARQIEGCRLGVMGLPLCQVARTLARFGVLVPVDVPASCRALTQRDCDVAFSILQK